MLITQGLAEMIQIAQALGAEVRPFLGLAGMGDLIATCYSPNSRNHTVDTDTQGETPDTILADMEEVAEGVKTIAIVNALRKPTDLLPLLPVIRILFERTSIEQAGAPLMELPYSEDVPFCEEGSQLFKIGRCYVSAHLILSRCKPPS